MKERNSGWNLEQMFNPLTRPKVFNQPTGHKTMAGCDSYIYEITNTQNQKKYIGFHKEGNHIYRTSSTNKEFKEILASDQIGILDIHIGPWGSVEECKQIEYEKLTEVNAKANPQYYNKHNGHPGKRKLNIELVNKLTTETDDVRKFRNQMKDEDGNDTREYINNNNVVEFTVKELYGLDNWQVRATQLDEENLNKVKDRVELRPDNYDMPVILKDVTLGGEFHEYKVISGNHTRTAYYELATGNRVTNISENKKIKCVVIDDDIHTLLQETEIDILGNNLNSDYNVGKPFSSADAVGECLRHHEAGHSWQTTEMKLRFQLLGLTSNQVTKVFEKAQFKITKKEEEDGGWTFYDYKRGKGKAKLEKKQKELTDENTHVVSCASGAPTLDRWMNSWLDNQLIRIEEGKTLQTKICVLVYHTNYKNRDDWEGMFKKLTSPQHIEDKNVRALINTLYKLPTFTYWELPMKTKK
tara:strand:+ start:99 stop:1508 length:1410 start_codon:yes stop_codon:yes gene_type:complete